MPPQNSWEIVNHVILKSDILLLVLDSRMPELTRNQEIEEKVKGKGKKVIYVLNKCDLVSKKEIENLKEKYKPSIFVSSTEKFGGTLLFKKILELSRGEECIVGVLGYPNVGKSSVINLLKGTKSSQVSSESGHTKSVQLLIAKGKLKILDTPGVLAFMEKDIEKMVMIGSINPSNVDDPEYYAQKLIEKYPKMFEKYYDEEIEGDSYDYLEKLAIKKNILKKGAKLDLTRLARNILQDWQKGKMHSQK